MLPKSSAKNFPRNCGGHTFIAMMKKKRFPITSQALFLSDLEGVMHSRIFTLQPPYLPFEFYGFVRTRRFCWEGIFCPQPRAQRSERFLVCVVFVFPNAPHGQDRTAEAQTFQRMRHQRWVGRAAERCLDATTRSVVCVGVDVCVPK